jgi:caffeoyl-CoA O-methyltransferase
MNFLDPALEAYCLAHTSPQGKILEELDRQTHLKVLKPRMLSGHLQGQLLDLLSKMRQPRRVLEIGTYTGYAALCLAQGLPPDGHLHTIELNEELIDMAQDYFKKAGMAAKITQHCGAAAEVIPTLTETWDIVFIDADKQNYNLYYDLVVEKMAPNGYIIADNVLWSGKVIEPVKAKDKSTQALLAFNKKVQADPRVENVLLPVRDGLMLCRVI